MAWSTQSSRPPLAGSFCSFLAVLYAGDKLGPSCYRDEAFLTTVVVDSLIGSIKLAGTMVSRRQYPLLAHNPSDFCAWIGIASAALPVKAIDNLVLPSHTVDSGDAQRDHDNGHI